MSKLEDLTRGTRIAGLRSDDPVEVLDVKWFGTGALELTYKGADGPAGSGVPSRRSAGIPAMPTRR
jgi:hypothetical protein